MNTLPLEFVKRRFKFKQLDRTVVAALYEQTDLVTGKVVGLEVFEVKVAAARVFGGREIPGGEYYPGDTSFGVNAWSIPVLDNYNKSFDLAWKRYERLNEHK